MNNSHLGKGKGKGKFLHGKGKDLGRHRASTVETNPVSVTSNRVNTS